MYYKMEEYKLKILKLEEKGYIKNLLDKCILNDIHCHPDYLSIFQEYQGNNAIYFYFGNEENYIIIPYFKRPIKILGFNEYFDLVSPWYYGGPIHNIKDEKLLQNIFSNFTKKLNEYCINNNIITEFQRLNPILRNYELYKNDPSLYFDRNIVYIDLTKDIETINKEYTRHTRKNLNKAKRNRLRVYSDESEKGMSKFIQVYTESMKKKNAREFYLFNDVFFKNFFRKFKNEIKLFHVEYKGKIVCSSAELGKYGVLHDYLRGVNSEHLLLRPNDILIDEIIRWAKSQGYKYFSLGGGASSTVDDGIFRFKKSFSSTTAKFYVYKKIHNLDKYKELCQVKGKNNLEFEKAQFFPEYII